MTLSFFGDVTTHLQKIVILCISQKLNLFVTHLFVTHLFVIYERITKSYLASNPIYDTKVVLQYER